MTAAETRTDQRWFWAPEPRPDAKVRLFCFPFAGSSAAAFRRWPAALPDWIETRILELPGRGTRRHEPLLTDIGHIVDGIWPVIGALLDKRYVLFGHSMGAFVAYELAWRLQESGCRVPSRLIVSGAAAPHTRNPNRGIHNLPESQFLNKIREMNGTPAEVLNTPELLKMVSPVLRADFCAAESYRAISPRRLLCPIAALLDFNTTVNFQTAHSTEASHQMPAGHRSAYGVVSENEQIRSGQDLALPEHLVELPGTEGEWALWRCVALRGAGFQRHAFCSLLTRTLRRPLMSCWMGKRKR